VKTREVLSNLVYNLDKFLSAESAVDIGINVLYATEPQRTMDGYVVLGAVELASYQYPFEISYNKRSRVVEIRSSIFWFRRSLKQIKELLREI